MQRLAWVTAGAVRGTDVDEPVALAALRAAGTDVEVVDWDDPQVDWAAFDRAVLRSTWDYDQRLPEFLRWLDAVAAVTDLRNPAPMVRWSSDKRYLLDLADAGVPVVPTAVVEPGQVPSWPDGPFVLKPAVGAGGREVATYGPAERSRALDHVGRLHAAGRGVLLQPRLASVASRGEWPLVYFGGRCSHAASRRVLLPEDGPTTQAYVPDRTAQHTATARQREVADAAVAVAAQRFGTPTCARVDLVEGDDGDPLVLELELVEPSLFLAEAVGTGAAQRLADALRR